MPSTNPPDLTGANSPMAATAPTARSRKGPSRPNAQRMAQRTASGLLGLHGERMSKVDTAWLRMDSPNNLMLINGVWTLHPGISREALCQRLQERLLAYPRFRQRVLEDAAGASWVEDRHFDLAQHVQTERLQPRPGQTHRHALQERVAELASLPLDPTRPLWQFHLIENHRDEQGREGSALVVRIHHCIADGIALISVTLSLVDGGQAPPQRSVRQKRQSPSQHPQAWIAEALIRPATDLTVKALGRVGNGAARSLAMLQPQQEEPADPSTHPGNGALDLARAAWQVATDAAALALMPDDSPTRLKGRAGTRKKVAWCDPVPLEDVRAIGKAFNCSINDVLLSCVAGAIGQYLRRQGDKVDGLEIRAMVPINLRPLDEAWKLGNRFGLVPLVLPVGVGNPIERLFEVRRRMNALKGSTQPLLAFGMLAVAGLLVKPAQDALLNLFSRKTTAVMTNVPGPKDKLLFCGSQLEQCMFWVPQSGDIGLGVSILTYGGGVQFGVIADTGLCPEPQLIIDEFLPEFERLVVMGLMLPWGRCWF